MSILANIPEDISQKVDSISTLSREDKIKLREEIRKNGIELVTKLEKEPSVEDAQVAQEYRKVLSIVDEAIAKDDKEAEELASITEELKDVFSDKDNEVADDNDEVNTDSNQEETTETELATDNTDSEVPVEEPKSKNDDKEDEENDEEFSEKDIEEKEDAVKASDEDESDELIELASKPVGTTQVTKVSTTEEAVDKADKGDEDSVKELEAQKSGEVDKTSQETKLEVETDPEAVEAEEQVNTEEKNTVNTDKPSEEELKNEKSSKKQESELALHDESAVNAIEKSEPQVTITAGADLGQGFHVGQRLAGLSDVARGLMNRVHAMGNTSGGDGEKHTVATFSLNDGVIDRLSSTNVVENTRKFEAISGKSDESIVASGGLFGPVETRYDLYTIGEKVRPVKDALPTFGAERGGVRYTLSPTLKSVQSAVSLWTLEDDKAAQVGQTSKVKPTLVVRAGEEVTVYTDAIPLSLTFGNFGARFAPEAVEAHIEMAMIQQARFAETRLLTRIGALSTAVTTEKKFGAARDIFRHIDQAVAGYRSRNRIGSKVTMTAIFPTWFREALRADLVTQAPGDGLDTFSVADNLIDSWFADRNIKAVWSLDGEAGQIFGEQTAGALLDFPDDLVWYLFAEGTFVFLDGGELNLGIVRDSTLNSTNDYQMFVETFEGVAKFGNESLKITSKLAIAGSYAGATDVADLLA